MTQQFKFGDKCYHLTGDMEVIIVSDEPVIADDGSKMWRIFDEDFGYHLCSDYKLELVPHPDTVRLDWIIKNGACIYDEDGKWTLDIDDDSPDCGDADAIRETIDCIMQQTHKRP